MNIYILVEGKTEKYVYPKWIENILPDLKQIEYPEDATDNNYYIFGNMGYPCIISGDLVNVITDEEIISKYDFLVISIDSDGEENISIRKQRIIDTCIEHGFDLSKLRIIIQNYCFETWCLGNRTVFIRTPESDDLKDCIQYYNVNTEDPEKMLKPSEFPRNTAAYHEYYLKQIFHERNMYFRKGRPAAKFIDERYLPHLIKRAEDTGHLESFSNFYNVFEDMKVLS
ncbi:hypothetical protein ETJ91_00595 [Bacillus albus]|uniref:hypothetical protein n=1 Tax=Bacillus cereus group TaxID=86661 RepID=UPI001009AB95|nr:MULTISPECIES: hypothetical protein [Bacillus cereus group]RXJ19897.1 hypothetical protein ETJ91_00595 [Bacillus albus]RXJ30026.1 hypothetical protein ETJ76_15495 [Bacillus albus]RXJ31618.1 hypothetical protein ETJ90_08270 [Bacillus albus]RXJ42842.1 hypothetical protein ETJ89_08275 [Bacillus albus]RXJ59770.1 hypothetical protein ETJ66_08270 [Bacillus albus]